MQQQGDWGGAHTIVHVVAGGANPQRLEDVATDVNFMADLEHHFPNGYILFVSQVLPHKRVDHALEILQLLRTVHRLNIGLVIWPDSATCI